MLLSIRGIACLSSSVKENQNPSKPYKPGTLYIETIIRNPKKVGLFGYKAATSHLLTAPTTLDTLHLKDTVIIRRGHKE